MSDNIEAVGEMLEAMSSVHTARRLQKQVRPLRGVRGVPMGEVARIAAAAFEEQAPVLPRDGAALSTLFSTAFEDGLVAIGLLATCVVDHPAAALDLGLDWSGRVDDVTTADALGWLVLGPACLATHTDIVDGLRELTGSGVPAIRRIAVSAGLAATPAAIEGPAAAPIRAKLGTAQVQWVEAAQASVLGRIATAHVRDEGPAVRKALRRLLREWARVDAAGVAAWGAGVRGGLPGMLGDEVKKAQRKAERLAQEPS